MINLFLSIERGQEQEFNFWNEIYGCVNYLNLPYDTVMNLPVFIRKFWIEKHNRDIREGEERASGNSDKTVDGISINEYARIEQAKIANGVPK